MLVFNVTGAQSILLFIETCLMNIVVTLCLFMMRKKYLAQMINAMVILNLKMLVHNYYSDKSYMDIRLPRLDYQLIANLFTYNMYNSGNSGESDPISDPIREKNVSFLSQNCYLYLPVARNVTKRLM